MRMRVNEPGHDCLAGQIEHARVGADEPLHRFIAADADEFAVYDREGLRPRLVRIDANDIRAAYHQFGSRESGVGDGEIQHQK
jgi:hypothetical protein